jgi:hypothetical protein
MNYEGHSFCISWLNKGTVFPAVFQSILHRHGMQFFLRTILSKVTRCFTTRLYLWTEHLNTLVNKGLIDHHSDPCVDRGMTGNPTRLMVFFVHF